MGTPSQVARQAAPSVSAIRDGLLLAATITATTLTLIGALPPLITPSILVLIVLLANALLPTPRALLQAVAVVLIAMAGAIVAGRSVARRSAAELVGWVGLLASVLVVTLVWRRMRRSSMQQSAVAEALAGLVRQVLGVNDPDELLRVVLRVAADLLRPDTAQAWRQLPDGRLTVAARYPNDESPTAESRPPAGIPSYLTAVLGDREPFRSTDVGLLAAPVLGTEGVLGVLVVQANRRRSYRLDGVATLRDIAGITAIAWDQLIERRRLGHQALHDPLTGLSNRVLLLDRIEHALTRRSSSRTDEPCVAVAMIDLDEFKSVNDTWGHAAGDAVLREVGLRLAAAVRPEDTVARFGGDEFTLLCASVPDEQVAVGIALRLLDACAQPMTVDRAVLTINASAGVALSTSATASAESMLREADAALYRAKEHGGGRVELFSPALQSHAQARLDLDTELRSAIGSGELTLRFLSVREWGSDAVVGARALVHWLHPSRGLLRPEQFLPEAETGGIIVPLGDWTLRAACEEVAARQRAQVDRTGWVSVRVSVRQLERPELAQEVSAAIAVSGLRPGTLALEIPASMLYACGDAAEAVVGRLGEAGARVIVSEFGTGPFSLRQLVRFPLAAIKIDSALTAGVPDVQREAMLAATVALGAELGVTVVADAST